MPELPTWLSESQKVTPPRPASRFLTRNLARLAHVLAHFNANQHVAEMKGSAWVALVSLLLTVLLTVTCQSLQLLWVLALLQLGTLLLLPSKMVGPLLISALKSCLFSAIVILPSLFFASMQTSLWWLAKLVVLMLEMQLFRHRVSWSALLLALRQLHVPSLFVLTLDITVKYSHVLGSSLQARLEAVELRSCGNLQQPLKLATSLIGRLYLQSRQNATELYQAMWLRGYTETPQVGHLTFKRADWPAVLQTALLIGLAVGLNRG